MFGKPASPAERAAEPPRKPIAASFVGADVRLSGGLFSDGDVQLDGALQGEAHVGRLTVGESGSVDGAIHGDCIEIRGRVRGEIAARAVHLRATADVEGDITHAELIVEAGARFVGRSQRLEAPVQTLSVATAAE